MRWTTTFMSEQKCQTNKIYSKNNLQKRAARVAAVQAIYSLRHGDSTADDSIMDLINLYQEQPLGLSIEKADEALLIKIVRGVVNNKDELIEKISGHILENWRFERLPSVVQGILLCGTCELLNLDSVRSVTINEYVEISKMLGHVSEASFVNHVLDAVSK